MTGLGLGADTDRRRLGYQGSENEKYANWPASA
jgi:hypothetical protein